MRTRLVLLRVASGAAWLVAAAQAGAAPMVATACDAPSAGPTDVVLGAGADGRALHLVTGSAGSCDPAARGFDLSLPALREPRVLSAQLALAGFSRSYGVRQIGISIGPVTVTPTAGGLHVQYVARIDGLDRLQLAYTLVLSAVP